MDQIHYGLLRSPVGNIMVGATTKGVAFLDFVDSDEEQAMTLFLEENYSLWTKELNGRFITEPLKQLREYFARDRMEFDCPIDLKGTIFQKKVWQCLQEIPYGTTKSYAQISQEVLGHSKGARAIGGANGKNPVAIIVPCHRVINKGGKLGGYSGGIDKKSWLLNWEETQDG